MTVAIGEGVRKKCEGMDLCSLTQPDFLVSIMNR
jgi:hypothetical protein